MQGTAADLIKLAMIAVQGWLDEKQLSTRLLLQVHDELILEVPERELDQVRAELPAHMCNVAALKVPLRVGVGRGTIGKRRTRPSTRPKQGTQWPSPLETSVKSNKKGHLTVPFFLTVASPESY